MVSVFDLPVLDVSKSPNLVRILHSQVHAQSSKLLPSLSEFQHVGVFSDYGGDEPDSEFYTYSFLLIGLDGTQGVLSKLEDVRAAHQLLDPRRAVCFKSLGYGPINRALSAWLKVSDELHGLLFTLAVDKVAHSVVTRNNQGAVRRYVADAIAGGVAVPQKARTAERFLRIAACVAYWVSALCRTGQNLIWIGDNDPSAAKAENLDALQRTTSVMVAEIRPGLTLNFAVGTESGVPEVGRPYLELLSYPDLACGALANAVTVAMPSRHRSRTQPATAKQKAGPIMGWLAEHGGSLTKRIFKVEPEGNGFVGMLGTVDRSSEAGR